MRSVAPQIFGSSASRSVAHSGSPRPQGAPKRTYEGRLESLGVARIVQVLNQERQTGTFSVSDGRKEGTIVFRDGVVLETTWSDLTGPAAFTQLLSLERGSFRFDARRTATLSPLQLVFRPEVGGTREKLAGLVARIAERLPAPGALWHLGPAAALILVVLVGSAFLVSGEGSGRSARDDRYRRVARTNEENRAKITELEGLVMQLSNSIASAQPPASSSSTPGPSPAARMGAVAGVAPDAPTTSAVQQPRPLEDRGSEIEDVQGAAVELGRAIARFHWDPALSGR